MPSLNYFKTPKKKQELNALLHIYELYKDVIYCYLNNPTNPSNKELNIFYIRKLTPTILGLIEVLKLQYLIEKKCINLNPSLILFSSLFVSEKELKEKGKTSDDARIEVFANYGRIKELVEQAKAVMQDPILEIEEVVDEGKEIVNSLNIKKYSIETNNNNTTKNTETGEIQIKYKKSLGQFIFNNNDSLTLEGKQKDTADILVQHGKDNKVSWDEIFESINDTTRAGDIVEKKELEARKRNIRGYVNEINTHAKFRLGQNARDLIAYKDNEYWLQYDIDNEVDKGR